MTSMMAKAVNKSTTTLCGHLANFEISQSVFSTNPIAIKVGKKESLRRNALYEITEKVADKTGRISVNHVAWVRAKSVSDNKSKSQGKSIPSTFYKVSGAAVSKGMLAKFIPDKGVALSVGYIQGNTLFSGAFLEVSKLIGIPKTRYGLKVNFGNMQTVDDENSFIAKNKVYFNASNMMFDIFINHSVQVSSFSLTPKLGIYYSLSNFKSYDERGITGEPMSDWGKNSDNVGATSIGLSTGLSLNYNIGKSTQITLRYEKGIDFFGTTLSDDHPGWTYGGRSVTPSFGSRSAIGIGITFLGF